ncbi:MAG: prephenate dehydrogenase [Chloroflexi bacterium]|nr:MAG: prephenate dehydrogenase [Chloroflexota bacterium]
MKDIDGFTIAIVGLGLMGGSLAMAFKQHAVGRRVLGMDPNTAAVERAQALGAIDGFFQDVREADLIVLAMPVRAIAGWLITYGPALAPEQTVMDLGSAKRAIMAEMEKLDAQCIGGHPMCGKETSGIAAAEATLFKGATFVLTPATHTSQGTMHMARQLVSAIGAEPLVMDADAHDRAVAAVSHLPYLLSANLVNTVLEQNDPNARLLASSGYASTTRLAASDTRMMGDTIASNRDYIVRQIDRFQSALAHMREAIAAGDDDTWRVQLERAREGKRNEL